MKKFLHWLSLAGYFGLFLSSVLLILAPFVDVINSNLKAYTWVGIFCGILSGFVIYFSLLASNIFGQIQLNSSNYNSLKDDFKIIVAQNEQIRHLSLLDAIKRATVQGKQIRDLRIYASTTAVMFQIIRDLKLEIINCQILIQYFVEDDANPNSAKLNIRCLELIDAWTELQESGKIKNLEVFRYNRYPSEYALIFDDQFLVLGKYTPSKTSPHGSNYHEPVLFENKTVETKKLIDDHIRWFDITFKYFKT